MFPCIYVLRTPYWLSLVDIDLSGEIQVLMWDYLRLITCKLQIFVSLQGKTSEIIDFTFGRLAFNGTNFNTILSTLLWALYVCSILICINNNLYSILFYIIIVL